MTSKGRAAAVVAILALASFWALRALLGGSDSTPTETHPPLAQPAESVTEVVQLAEPRGLGGIVSPTRFLRNLYPSLWNADGYCWEEGTSDHDAANARTDTALADGDEAPPELLELFEGRRRGYHDYEHKSFNSNRLLFLHQEMVTTAGGQEGPLASALTVIRMEAPNGRQFWTIDESRRRLPL